MVYCFVTNRYFAQNKFTTLWWSTSCCLFTHAYLTSWRTFDFLHLRGAYGGSKRVIPHIRGVIFSNLSPLSFHSDRCVKKGRIHWQSRDFSPHHLPFLTHAFKWVRRETEWFLSPNMSNNIAWQEKLGANKSALRGVTRKKKARNNKLCHWIRSQRISYGPVYKREFVRNSVIRAIGDFFGSTWGLEPAKFKWDQKHFSKYGTQLTEIFVVPDRVGEYKLF